VPSKGVENRNFTIFDTFWHTRFMSYLSDGRLLTEWSRVELELVLAQLYPNSPYCPTPIVSDPQRHNPPSPSVSPFFWKVAILKDYRAFFTGSRVDWVKFFYRGTSWLNQHSTEPYYRIAVTHSVYSILGSLTSIPLCLYRNHWAFTNQPIYIGIFILFWGIGIYFSSDFIHCV